MDCSGAGCYSNCCITLAVGLVLDGTVNSESKSQMGLLLELKSQGGNGSVHMVLAHSELLLWTCFLIWLNSKPKLSSLCAQKHLESKSFGFGIYVRKKHNPKTELIEKILKDETNRGWVRHSAYLGWSLNSKAAETKPSLKGRNVLRSQEKEWSSIN